MQKNLTYVFFVLLSVMLNVGYGGDILTVPENIGVNPDFQAVEVLSVYKHIDTKAGEDELIQACKKWKLNKKQIKNVFKLAQPLSASEWNYRFSHLPCSYGGNFRYQGETYRYYLNAGGYFQTDVGDLVIDGLEIAAFGCLSNKCYHYFLDKPFFDD